MQGFLLIIAAGILISRTINSIIDHDGVVKPFKTVGMEQ